MKNNKNIIKDYISEYKNYTFMSEYDLEFICEMIEKYRPKKILELGIGYGGTNMIIKKCLSLYDYKSSIFSIDINKTIFWGDERKDIGFAIKHIDNINIFSKIYLGVTLPEIIDEIGEDIDFVILDTTHALPGELLDFIICLPYLSRRACVIVHDIVAFYAHDIEDEKKLWSSPNAIATCLLLSSVVGEKTIVRKEEKYGFANIASFEVNEETRKNIDNLFISLMIRWAYFPGEVSIEKYKEIIREKYGDSYRDFFDNVCKLNFDALKRTSRLNKDYITY